MLGYWAELIFLMLHTVVTSMKLDTLCYYYAIHMLTVTLLCKFNLVGTIPVIVNFSHMS